MRCISNFSFLGDKITVIIRNFVVSSYHRQESKHNHYFNLSCKGDYDHGYEILQMFHCGNIVAYVQDNGPKVVCCGEEMKEMVANTTDAAHGKACPCGNGGGKPGHCLRRFCYPSHGGKALHPVDQPADRAGKSARKSEARSGAYRHLRHGSRRQVCGRL